MKNLNFEIYGRKEPVKENFPGYEAFLLNGRFIKPGISMLDIGGASGSFLEMINREICLIDATVIDSDADCINYGRWKYPWIRFVCADFPNIDYSAKYDIVTMQALFPHLPDWKKTVFSMVRLAKKYINFVAIVREFGHTVDDRDVSYLYYLNTGKRVHQTILNLHEFLNFLCLEEVRAKKIWFHGAHMFDYYFNFTDISLAKKEAQEASLPLQGMLQPVTKKAHAFRGVPFYDEIVGNFMIELFDEKDNPKRMGGLGILGKDFPDDYQFFMPDINVFLDGFPYFIYEGKEQMMYYNVGNLMNTPTFLRGI